MFVRAVWRLRRLIDLKQALRETDVPTTRDGLGMSGNELRRTRRGPFGR